jgi:hypothetical protein
MTSLRTEEVVVEDVTYTVREPKLADFMACRGMPGEEFIVNMLGTMVLGENGEPIGAAAVGEFPLRAFAPLADVVNRMVAPPTVPLDPNSGSSTG